MTSARQFAPRLMPAPAAAEYLGISESKLRTLGLPRKQLDGKRLYERSDLDDYADRLPYEGDLTPSTDSNTCTGKFGRARLAAQQ